MDIEWARITSRSVVVAASDRAWVHELSLISTQDPFAEPMGCRGMPTSTRQLLDAAVCAAIDAAPAPRPQRALSLPRYVWMLVGYAHSTRATPRLMAEAEERFLEARRRDCVELARRIIEFESGDEELALEDLRALGYDAEYLVSSVTPPTADLVEYFAECVRGPEPVSAFGYCYALERASLSVDQSYLESLKALLPPYVEATRCRRLHSSLGADVAHVATLAEAMATLPAPDRERIARAVYETTLRIASSSVADSPSDEELARKFAKFVSKPHAKEEFPT